MPLSLSFSKLESDFYLINGRASAPAATCLTTSVSPTVRSEGKITKFTPAPSAERTAPKFPGS